LKVVVQFTGKERDAETGLDYFGARYFSGAQGRFTSPDEPLMFADPENPQSWNLYSYAFNNPLLYSDPDGHEPCVNGVNPENGNICTVVTAPKPADPPDMSWFTEMFLRSLVTTVQVTQQVQQVVQPVADWLSQPRNPTCMAGYTGVGASIGFWAGGGLGTLGLAGGPAAAATIPGGAAGGAALGGGIGGVGGMIMCSSGTWGGSGGGRGGDYREKTRGANANDQKQISAAARQVGVDGRPFGRYVEKIKKLEGRGASENFSFDELVQLAREFKGGSR
jgi:RHS repeat-associated protein